MPRKIETIEKEILELKALNASFVAACEAYVHGVRLEIGRLLLEAKEHTDHAGYVAFLKQVAKDSPLLHYSKNKRGTTRVGL